MRWKYFRIAVIDFFCAERNETKHGSATLLGLFNLAFRPARENASLLDRVTRLYRRGGE